MKIGVRAFAWTTKLRPSHFDLFPKLREHGIEGFEVPLFDPAELPAADLRRAIEANGLECTVCAILPAGINPISPDPTVRKHSLAAAEQVKMNGMPNDLIVRLSEDAAFDSVDLAHVLNPSAFIGRAPEQVEAFVREVVQPIRERYPHAHAADHSLKV